MSFIYEDKELLEKLFTIAKFGQAKPVDPDQLKGLALKLVNNLRVEASPIKAAGPIKPSDIYPANNLINWLERNNATYNGKPIVSGDKISEDLAPFLEDLRQKLAQTNNPYLTELLA